MYPILLKLEGLKILVVGGGAVASRKVRELVASGGHPVVIALSITAELAESAAAGVITWRKRPYRHGDVCGFQLVFACTDQRSVNRMIEQELMAGQLFNDVSDKTNSRFYNMSFVRNEQVGLAVTTFGKDPAYSKALKAYLTTLLSKLPKRAGK